MGNYAFGQKCLIEGHGQGFEEQTFYHMVDGCPERMPDSPD